MTQATPVLINSNNFAQFEAQIIAAIQAADFIGYDIESYDHAHDGILQIRSHDKAKVIFDVMRTVVAGFSIYPEGHDHSYYINLSHADEENRVPWVWAKRLLDAKRAGAHWIAHNAPFELTMMRNSLSFEMPEIICTLQMAVSAFGPDEYSKSALIGAGFGEISTLFMSANREFMDFNGGELTPKQQKVLSQLTGKESKAAHSYNGHIRSISYGYDLKKLVKSFFDVKMTTYQEVTQGRHMGELTGQEVFAYGADDAYWAVRLFRALMQYMAETNPAVITTFFEQENPMVHVFADVWSGGLTIDEDAVTRQRDVERSNYADTLRELRQATRALLPWSPAPPTRFTELEAWYATSFQRYRDKIGTWALLPDATDDRKECSRVSSSVSKAWDGVKSPGPNFTYWREMRVLFYDLCGIKPIVEKGKVQSDDEARGKLIETVKDDPKKIRLINAITKLAHIEQAMKLYLTPYSLMIDPDTGRMYPNISSKLATRRMAASFPNPMQLAKQGDTKYIRGFYKPDADDHVVISNDWSQVELVTIGDMSGDPKFREAYGQLPYKDLHLGAAAAILSAIYGVEVTADQFKALNSMADDVVEPYGFPLVDASGKVLTPKDAYKFNRGTSGGKGANFGYWYSGALSSVAASRGVSSELMWKMTENYREEYAVAEEWRRGVIAQTARDGFITLPDHHRRVRYESTGDWARHWQGMFAQTEQQGLIRFGGQFIRKVQTRSGNQAVNALVQGTCATLAKRSVIRIIAEIKKRGLRARFMMPIHDEVVWSVHKNDALEFIIMSRQIMTDHPDIIQTLPLHCTTSIGRTFEPYHPTKAPFGQIELDELPDMLGLPVGLAANENQRATVLDYLFTRAA